jgi:hypothetical protein
MKIIVINFRISRTLDVSIPQGYPLALRLIHQTPLHEQMRRLFILHDFAIAWLEARHEVFVLPKLALHVLYFIYKLKNSLK